MLQESKAKSVIGLEKSTDDMMRDFIFQQLVDAHAGNVCMRVTSPSFRDISAPGPLYPRRFAVRQLGLFSVFVDSPQLHAGRRNLGV